MTASIEATDSPAIRWTLSLLPALIGLAGVAALVGGAVVSGIPAGRQGWTSIAIAAILVAATVISGSSYGLYLALAILAAGGLIVNGGPTAFELSALILTLVIVHEVVRFALDARRPSRFARGLPVRYGLRTITVGIILVGLGLGVEALVERAPSGQLWIPISVAATAIPTFALFGAERLQTVGFFDHPARRVAVGGLLTVALVAVVVVGAQARGEIVATSVTTQTTTDPATTTTTEPIAESTVVAERTVQPWMVAVTIALIAVFIFFMLRRPEADFQLEEAEQPIEDRSYDLGAAGLADSEAEMVSLDQESLAKLLGDLQLDISAERDPGRAIRYGYATIEQRLADMGLRRAATETEREFLQRVVAPLGSAAEAMATLTALFEQARFTDGATDEAMRQRALGAIDDLIIATGSPNAGPPPNEARR